MSRRFLMMTAAVALLAVPVGTPARAVVQGKEVAYSSGDLALKGYLTWDDAEAGKRPGVIVVHEWWGHNEYARRRARMLAELGYVGFAIDMYGEGKQAAHPDDAGKFAGELMKDAPGVKARFIAALEVLRRQEQVDPGRIAAIGYCFGGGVVLNMARQGVDLKGVASFHGSLAAVAPAKPGAVKGRILVFHGAADSFVPPEQVAAFQKEMTDAQASVGFISYPGALHGFTNPEADEAAKKFGMAVAYDAEADRKSWEELKVFLVQIFR